MEFNTLTVTYNIQSIDSTTLHSTVDLVKLLSVIIYTSVSQTIGHDPIVGCDSRLRLRLLLILAVNYLCRIYSILDFFSVGGRVPNKD